MRNWCRLQAGLHAWYRSTDVICVGCKAVHHDGTDTPPLVISRIAVRIGLRSVRTGLLISAMTWNLLVASASTGGGRTARAVIVSCPGRWSLHVLRSAFTNLTSSCGLMAKSRGWCMQIPSCATYQDLICTTKCPSGPLRHAPDATAALKMAVLSQFGGGIIVPTISGPLGPARTSGTTSSKGCWSCGLGRNCKTGGGAISISQRCIPVQILLSTGCVVASAVSGVDRSVCNG